MDEFWLTALPPPILLHWMGITRRKWIMDFIFFVFKMNYFGNGLGECFFVTDLADTGRGGGDFSLTAHWGWAADEWCACVCVCGRTEMESVSILTDRSSCNGMALIVPLSTTWDTRDASVSKWLRMHSAGIASSFFFFLKFDFFLKF